MRIDKNFLIFIIAALTVAAVVAIYPTIISNKQDDIIDKSDYIINKLDQLQANRTRQFLSLINQGLTNQEVLEKNQELALKNHELIKRSLDETLTNQYLIQNSLKDAKTTRDLIENNTAKNLNLTLHNRAMLDQTYDDVKVLVEMFGVNDTKKMMEILNLSHNDSELMAMWRAQQQGRPEPP